jgi:hypothetical protein
LSSGESANERDERAGGTEREVFLSGCGEFSLKFFHCGTKIAANGVPVARQGLGVNRAGRFPASYIPKRQRMYANHVKGAHKAKTEERHPRAQANLRETFIGDGHIQTRFLRNSHLSDTKA